MAPFGGKFLKTRLKSRCEGKDGEPGKEIQVWVQREEKIVCGLTKHTTCTEVVQALLEDQASSPGPDGGQPADYCLLERWKGFERALPPLTRILRLWTAWGEQQPFVQFVLVQARHCGARTGGPAAAEPKPGSATVTDPAPAQYVRSLPVERQKRMVRKAFRKLEKMRERERAPPGDEERVHGLVQLIVSQDRTLREQARRMQELDREIERVERGLGAPLMSPLPPSLADGAAWRPLDHPGPADGLGCLERQLERHRDLIERLSREIDAEMRSACAVSRAELPASEGTGPGAPPDMAEADQLRRDLEHSMYRGLTLHSQLADLERELDLNRVVLGSKTRECDLLAAELSALTAPDPPDSADEAGGSSAPGWTEPAGTGSAQTELHKVLSHGDGTDTDSDTGISSTHSQDSLSPCVDIRPPLETQV